MEITWKTPGGTVYELCAAILNQPHALIAGATGSGKSVLLNSLIYTALYKCPCDVELILIDPKRVELCQYRNLPHTINYSSEPEQIAAAIEKTVLLMENRYKAMQRKGKRKSDQSHVYMIIDEFADLMTVQKQKVLPKLCRIAQLGRASNIHLIIASQRPTSDIINGQIKVNIDCRLALRCPTRRDSQNIINAPGAETLPRYGYGYLLTPDGLQCVKIPHTPEAELHARVQHWTKQHRFIARWIHSPL